MSYKINLTDRGPSVISSIDHFDECHYGADKLFFRGKYYNPADILVQIKIALSDSGKGEGFELDMEKLKEMYPGKTEDEIISILGIGDPLTITPDGGDLTKVPTIALNRFHKKDKKFWENRIPNDIANPYKANAAVTFGIRVIFKEDSAYITFGVPWGAIMVEETDETETKVTGSDLLYEMALLSHRNISKEDSLLILEQIFKTEVDVRGNTDKMKTTTHVIRDLYDSDGSLICC